MALAATALAGLALWSWAAQVADILTFSPRHIAMAPSTALVAGILGLALYVTGCRLGRADAARRLVHVLAILALAAAILVGLRHAMAWASPFETWLAQTREDVDGIPLGQMSPLTAAALAVVALSILAAPRGGTGSPSLRRGLAAGCAALAAGAGLVVAGSYAAGYPLLYGSGAIPMALWTAATVAILGLASLLNLRPDGRDGAPRRRRAMVSFIVGILTVVIGTVGAIHLRREQALRRNEARGVLEAVANLKVRQVETWRRERMGDATFLAHASFFAEDARTFLADRTSRPARDALRHWMTLLKAGTRYAEISLFDPAGHPAIGVLNEGLEATPLDPKLIAAAARSNDVIVCDLHGIDGSANCCMDFIFALFVPSRTPDAPRELIGAVRMSVDPRAFLFPMVRAWPIPTRSAEVQLARIEGDEIVALSSGPGPDGAPFRRVRIADSRRPGTLATRGHPGFHEGVDDRGVPVFARTSPVPETAWLVSAKIDRSEILAPLRRQAWLTLTATAVLALAAGLLAGLVWRTREADYAHRELEAERQRQALSKRIEHLMRDANDIILLADGDERIIEANDRAVEAYGYSREELLARRIPDLRAPDAAADFEAQHTAFLTQGHARFETVNRRKDGSLFPVEVSASLVEIDGVGYRLGIIRDITERKAHEREIERLTGLYATLSDVNQSLVRATTREGIFADTCRIVAKHTGFRAVWIGCVDPATRTMVPASFAGDAAEYVRHVHVRLDEEPDNRGPALICLLEGRPCVVNDFLHDPRMRRKHALAAEHGIRATAAFPLRFRGEVCGVLMVYSGECDVFREREVALLEEVALDVSFGLDSLDREEKRRAAEDALRRQADELRQRNDELERFNRASVGRELRMVDLKRRINELCREAGRPEPYALDFDNDPGSRQHPAG